MKIHQLSKTEYFNLAKTSKISMKGEGTYGRRPKTITKEGGTRKT